LKLFARAVFFTLPYAFLTLLFQADPGHFRYGFFGEQSSKLFCGPHFFARFPRTSDIRDLCTHRHMQNLFKQSVPTGSQSPANEGYSFFLLSV